MRFCFFFLVWGGKIDWVGLVSYREGEVRGVCCFETLGLDNGVEGGERGWKDRVFLQRWRSVFYWFKTQRQRVVITGFSIDLLNYKPRIAQI